MQYKNIINELKVNCPLPEAFEETPSQASSNQSSRKLVHIRADYSKGKWWNTIWPYHDELSTPEIRRDVDAVYNALTSSDAFSDLHTLTALCLGHPEAQVNGHNPDEFHFYFISELCYYRLHCICRTNDYNLYLHVFLKNMEVGPDA
ncbi:hypothetical protein [Anaerotignum sp.]|uniref:hypothetical protein n=1 Tax=Anaerotignum sp. TaxID=2039241 RepID=UPI0028AEFD16|nr:hypothetical protein [Anaerotignum sp.]